MLISELTKKLKASVQTIKEVKSKQVTAFTQQTNLSELEDRMTQLKEQHAKEVFQNN